MGRKPTGATTTGECLKLDVKLFSEEIKKGIHSFQSSVSWSNGARIAIALSEKDGHFVATLAYISTGRDGEKHHIIQHLRLVSVPSNLNKGEVFYFICPYTSNRCKILYSGYDSHYFKSREAYERRIYYFTQNRSRLDRHNDQYWRLSREIEGMKGKQRKTHYKGRKTALQQRIERVTQKRDYHDEMRWIIIPKAVARAVITKGLPSARCLF